MSLAQAVWLGIVQGLTEFLPISSSAHLILVRELSGWDAGAAEIPFDVACHLGTLLAVLVYFRRDVLALAAAAPRALAGGGGDDARTGRLILLATAPVVPLGLLLSGHIDRLRGPAVVAAALAAGAVAMLWADRDRPGPRRASSLSVVEALVLGCAQAAALVPGVSRSGAIITAALLLGLSRPEAARFAFLLGIPAIAGGGLQAARMLGGDGLAANAPALLAGLVTSGVVGYLAVAGLLRYLSRHSLAAFAWYRLAVAAALAFGLAFGR